MTWLKNLSLLSKRAGFTNGITGAGLFWHRGVESYFNNSSGILKIVSKGGYAAIHRYWYAAFTGHLGLGSGDIGILACSMSGVRMLKLQHGSSLLPKILEKPSTTGHSFGSSVRQEHSVSREWLAKRRAEEKRKKDIMRKRKRRYALRAESKEPMLDAAFKFPFIQSFFTKSTPAEQGWQTKASMQPPMSQYEEGLLYPETPEEVKLAPFLKRQFAVVENPGLWNWTFTLKDEDGNVLAQIDRDGRGFGLELFTDAGQYVIRFGNTYSSSKIGLASAVYKNYKLSVH